MSETPPEAGVPVPEPSPRSAMEENLARLFTLGDFRKLRAEAEALRASEDEEVRTIANEYLLRLVPDLVVLYALAALFMTFATLVVVYLPRR